MPRDLLAGRSAARTTGPRDLFADRPASGRLSDAAGANGMVGEQADPRAPFSGSILPFTRSAEGDVSFDSNAGLFGAAKRAFLLPSDVMEGRVDPNSDEAIARAVEFAGMASPINPAIRIGERAIPGVAKAMREVAPSVPTRDELKSAASAGYDAVRDAGVDYKSESVRQVADQIRRNLEGDGILDALAPKTFNILGRLESPPEGSVASISGLEAARRSFGNARKDFANPTEQEAGRRAVRELDRFIEAADPSSVVAGPAGQAGNMLREARANSAAGKRSGTLQGIEESAELRASVANSGQNLDNSARRRLADLILNPKKAAGFDGVERAQIEQIARGTKRGNALRSAGNILGGGGGLGSMVAGTIGSTLGAAATGPMGALVGGVVVPAMGAVMKKSAAGITQRGLRGVDEMTRMRSPLYQKALANPQMMPEGTAMREAILRAILGGSLQGSRQ